MKKVLIISYYFPPNAGAHVQRITKFAKYLSCFGYEPIILTNKIHSKRTDNILASEVSHIKKYYCPDLGKIIPGEIKKTLSRFLQPDKQSIWRFTLIKYALKIIKKENIDIVFVSNPPHSVGYFGSIISNKAKIPYVLDFRDEWITFPLFKKKKHLDVQEAMYNKMLLNCTAITTINKTIKERLKKSFPNEIPCHVIYNGFDDTDIPEITNNITDGKIRICYIGRFIHFHDPTAFFKMLQKILLSDDSIRNNIEFISIGDRKTNESWMKKFPEILSITEFTGYIPLQEAYKIIGNCDVCLVSLTNYGESSAFPLKVFDYVAMEKPIIAFLEKKDEFYDFLEGYNASCIILTENNSDVEDTDRLFRFLKNVKSHTINIKSSYKVDFARKKQTQKLAEVFNKCLNL
ncbi:MAG: glycosyltransferase [Candidatus Delongbacteria bacterium]|nr:glycosyltransferase [Candidatus Delongbacteria bacterium]